MSGKFQTPKPGRRATLTLGILATLLATATALAQYPQPIRTILNPVPEAGDNFGRNIMSTPDGMIFTGSAYSNINNIEAGQAYMINANNGQVIHTFNHPQPANDTGFGAFIWAGTTKVAISAPATAVAGQAGAGVVYLFNKTTGSYTGRIDNPTPTPGEDFGYGLSMLGDRVLVGSRGDDTDGNDTGIAYMFDPETRAILQTYRIGQPSTQDNLGYSLVGINDIVAIGAPGSDHEGPDSGRVYVYQADTGTLLHTLKSPTPQQAGNFGFQVRARGNDILVGAPGEQRAHLFDGNTGKLLRTFPNPTPATGSVFGSTVGSVGHFILIGDPLATFNGHAQAGRAYLFHGNTGQLIQRFVDPNPGTEQRFGVGVTEVQGKILISADQENVNGLIKSGALYIFNGPITPAQNWQLFN